MKFLSMKQEPNSTPTTLKGGHQTVAIKFERHLGSRRYSRFRNLRHDMKTITMFSGRSLQSLTTCLLAALLCSCASTTVKKTWKAPDYQGGAIKKVAVLAVTDRVLLRQGFENRFVTQIRERGAEAVVTHDELSLPHIKENKQAAAERLHAAGAEGVVILRLMNVDSTYREYRTGEERYSEYVTGFGSAPWYDYYTVAYMDMTPTYGNLKQKVYLETALFDLKTNKRVWSGLTQTVLTETMDRVAEMDPIVEKVVAAMRKDGMLP